MTESPLYWGRFWRFRGGAFVELRHRSGPSVRAWLSIEPKVHRVGASIGHTGLAAGQLTFLAGATTAFGDSQPPPKVVGRIAYRPRAFASVSAVLFRFDSHWRERSGDCHGQLASRRAWAFVGIRSFFFEASPAAGI